VLVDPELRFAVSGGGSLVTGAQPGVASNFFFTLDVTADGPLTAFGADTRFWARDIELTLLDDAGAPLAEPAILTPPADEFAFFGIVSDAPFATLSIRAGNDDFVNYDNLSYQVVPLPPALPLMAGALAFAGVVRRRRARDGAV